MRSIVANIGSVLVKITFVFVKITLAFVRPVTQLSRGYVLFIQRVAWSEERALTVLPEPFSTLLVHSKGRSVAVRSETIG